MRGTISKIHPISYSRNGGAYIRLEFKLEDKSWAKTDLVPKYRNYERWRNLLQVGTDLVGLTLKKKGEIDADSYPERFVKPAHGEWITMPDGTMGFRKFCPEEMKQLPPLDPEPIQPKLI
jgi:hypothetical protein